MCAPTPVKPLTKKLLLSLPPEVNIISSLVQLIVLAILSLDSLRSISALRPKP